MILTRLVKRKAYKKDISKILTPVVWHPTRWRDWSTSEGKKKKSKQFSIEKKWYKLVTGTKIWLEVGQDGGKSYKSLGKVLGSSKELAKLGKCGGKQQSVATLDDKCPKKRKPCKNKDEKRYHKFLKQENRR